MRCTSPKTACALLVILSLAISASPLQGQPWFEITLLPDQGFGSKCLGLIKVGEISAAELGASVSCGWVGDSGGTLQAAAWVQEEGTDDWSLEILPSATVGMDSWANACCFEDSADVLTEIIVVGAAYDALGKLEPMVWRRSLEGSTWSRDVLPVLPGDEGEASSLEFERVAENVVAGWSLDGSMTDKAVVWIEDDTTGSWDLKVLPHYDENLAGGGKGICSSGESSLIACGWATDPGGFMIPQTWHSANAGQDWSRKPLPLLPAGIGGLTATVSMSSTPLLLFSGVGIIELPGSVRATRWESSDGESWSANDLGTLPGHSSSQAFDDLGPTWGSETYPGSVAGWSGSNPWDQRVATFWFNEGGKVKATDLNRAVVGSLPLNLHESTGMGVVADGRLTISGSGSPGGGGHGLAAQSNPQAYVLVETMLVPATRPWPTVAVIAVLLAVVAVVGLRWWRP